jgi:tetrahydromethanopterin S-methyltransferase subunit G
MAAFMQAELAQDSSIASILNRLDKIERRLDLNS